MQTQLQTSPLGSTGLDITGIGFGAWAIGGGGWEFGWGSQDDDESVAAIHRAVELGVNWMATAAAYGFGRSETAVGRALAGMTDRPYVFTKCSLVEGPGRRVEHSLDRDSILREAEASLERFDVAQLRRIQQLAPVETLQPEYSLVACEAEDEILPFAEREQIGVIVHAPMGSGLLTGMTRERIATLPDDGWRKTAPRFTEPQLSRNRRASRVDPLVEAANLDLSDDDVAAIEGRDSR